MKTLIRNFLVLIFLITLSSCTQTINYESEIEHIEIKNGIWNYKGKTFSGVLLFNYENGQLQTKVNLKKGKRDGLTEFYTKNGQLSNNIKYKNGDKVQENIFYDTGELYEVRNYILDNKNGPVRHKYKKGILYEIDINYEDWKEGDTILHPYKLKRYNEFGQINSIGIVKPLTVEDDSDFFEINEKLGIVEIFAYNKSFGKKFINGRANGLIELIHPNLHSNTKYDLRTGSKQDKAYWSSPEIETETNEKISRYSDNEEYLMFNGIRFFYNHEFSKAWNKAYGSDEDFTDSEVVIDNEISIIETYKDGLILFDLEFFLTGSEEIGADVSWLFKKGSIHTNLSDYLTEKKDVFTYDDLKSTTFKYFLEDIKLIEDKLEFRFGNYKDTLSPVVFTYNDLIKSPQGKLTKQ